MSLSGMTGFARREGAIGAWTWVVEARSVNGRSLEVRFRGPPGFEGLERIAREGGQARFQRGQVGVNIQARRAEPAGGLRINRDRLQLFLALADELVATGKSAPPRADGLLGLSGVVEGGELEDAGARGEAEKAISVDLLKALDDLTEARREEGRALGRLIGGFVDRIATLSNEATSSAAEQHAQIHARFVRRIEELAGAAATPDRIVQEAAIMATRADVREELDRITTHLSQARTLLSAGGPCGRRLDFLAQEFMREANTLTAKSASPTLSAAGLELKVVIDQLREQVQNVE